MDNSILEKHSPCIGSNVLGIDGFECKDSIFCIMTNGDSNFFYFGIVEDSILFVDPDIEFDEGMINIYLKSDGTYKLSRTALDYEYKGRVIMSMNIF